MENLIYTPQTFLSAELRNTTTKIRTAGDNIRKNYLKIAHLLYTVDNEEMYLEDDFESVIDYAQKVFSIGKSTAYTFITIGREWVNEEGTRTTLTDGEKGADYSISQIGVLFPIGFEKAKELHDAGEISPEMSVRTLKAYVQKLTRTERPEDVDEGEETEGTTETHTKTVGKITFLDDGEIAIEGDFPEWFTIELDELYKKVLEGGE